MQLKHFHIRQYHFDMERLKSQRNFMLQALFGQKKIQQIYLNFFNQKKCGKIGISSMISSVCILLFESSFLLLIKQLLDFQFEVFEWNFLHFFISLFLVEILRLPLYSQCTQ